MSWASDLMQKKIGWGQEIGATAVFLFVASLAAAQDWKAPADAKATRNSVTKAAGIKDGKAVYDSNCVVCHGITGKGDGPAAVAMNPKPKDLREKTIQVQTDGELYWKISEGRGAMPPWKHFPDHVRWSLVHYVRSLAGKR